MSTLLAALPIVLAQAAPPGPTWDNPAPPPTWNNPTPTGPMQPAPPDVSDDDEVVDWFVRLDIGVGPRGLSENSALLSDMGYGDAKMWITMDGAWMFHERVGAGLWLGLNRRSGGAESSDQRGVEVVSWFIGAELPILLAGNRAWALQLTPRAGYATGRIHFTNFSGNSAGLFQHTGTFGGAFSFQSFLAHFGASIALMHSPAGPPGKYGRNMDYGGFYFSLNGTIDD
jgi:hypothetical protein